MDPESALHDVFGLAEFRPGQRAVVDSVLSGRPTVAVMPTGAGKSLCFQLPAVCAGGTSLVVSPLIALMKDQVDALTARGIAACAITSALSAGEQAARLADVARGRVRLAYVAPERFKSARFEEALDQACSEARLALLAVDEAHCISEWGHDFRPDYMRLGDAVERWRPERLVALTATATPEVRRDIQKQLGLVDPAVFVRGFDRPNLRFSVEHLSGGAAKTQRLLTLVRAAPGHALVYAATRKNAEGYAEELASAGLRARAYHAGLPDATRAATQDAFMNDELDVVVATNAFGMGIDKADLRLVVHADLPRSIEAYYQEAGRGGRDGDPAECVLLFNHADVKLQEFLIDASAPSLDLLRSVWRSLRTDPRRGHDPAILRRSLPGSPSDAAVSYGTRFLLRAGYLRERDGLYEAVHPSDDSGASPARLDAGALAARADVERQKLRAMVDYAYTTGCRRRFILAYFGDEDGLRAGGCGEEQRCDVCSTVRRVPTGDERERVHAVLALAARLDGRFGRTRLAAILVGDDDDDRFLELAGRGVLRRQGTRGTLALLRSIEGAGLLASSRGEYPTLSITPLGRRVLAGEEVPLALPEPVQPKLRKKKERLGSEPPARAPSGAADEQLLDRLRAFRRDVATREAVPAFCVFSDRTLDEIARARPPTLDALAAIHGVGSIKLARYGEGILEIIGVDGPDRRRCS
jgi:ATP-dependent DNA helicase RecQ